MVICRPQKYYRKQMFIFNFYGECSLRREGKEALEAGEHNHVT